MLFAGEALAIDARGAVRPEPHSPLPLQDGGLRLRPIHCSPR